MQAARVIEDLLNRAHDHARHDAILELTLPVFQLEASWALTRVGNPGRASELAVAAGQALRVRGIVENCAADLFEARISGPATFGDVIGRWIPRLDFMVWYQLVRLGQHSQVLQPVSYIDGMASCGGSKPFGPMRVPPPVVVRVARSKGKRLPAEELNTLLTGARPAQACDVARKHLVACAAQGLPAVLEAAEPLTKFWESPPDRRSSSVHWNLTAIGFFDAVVFAIAQAVNPLVIS